MLVEKIRELMKEKGIKQKDLVEYLGVNQPSVSKWLSTNEAIRLDIPNTILAKIARYLGVSVEYLLCMEDEPMQLPTIQTDDNYVAIPTIHAGAGAEAFAVDTPEMRMYPKELIPPQIALDENLMIISVVGNSMEPLYYENDIVFVDMVNGRDFVPVNGTYLVRYGDTVQIKDVEFLGNGQILLFSRNSPAVINPTKLGLDWEIVGKPYVNWHPTIGSKLKIKE